MKLSTDTVKVIIISGVVAVVTNGAQFFISSNMSGKTEAKYVSQIEQLNATIEAIGPLVDCWSVTDTAKAESGTTVLENDLESIKIPESCVQENYVLDKYNVVGKFYKVDLKAGTPLTTDLFMENELDDTSRELDITANIFPIGLKIGDYVDFRLLYPRGEDYVAVSHLRVEEINGETIKCILDEQQILFYDSATIENFINKDKGSMTYLAKYTEPGIQEPAKVTYSVPQAIINLLESNPNILTDISNGSVSRDVIDSSTESLDDTMGGKISSGRSELIGKIQSAKELYDSVQAEKEIMEEADAEGSGEEEFGATDANGLPISTDIDLTGGTDVTGAETAEGAEASEDTGGVE